MAKIEFLDSNVFIGPERVLFRDRIFKTDDIVERLKECGINEACVFHSTSVENTPAYGNMRLIDEIRDLPGFYPVWAILPFTTGELGSPEEFFERAKQYEVKGVLLYSSSHSFINSEWLCGEMYQMLERKRIPVFTRIGTDFSWSELHDLLSAHPNLLVILRDVGYRSDRILYRLLDRFRNLYVETGRYLVFRAIEDIVRRFGAERLIFGSGAPRLSPGAATTPVLLSDISVEEKRMIAGDNLRRLISEVDYSA